MKQKTTPYTLWLTDGEKELVTKVITKSNYRSAAEMWRDALRRLAKKEVPAYVDLAAERSKDVRDDITDEDYCINVHGGVIEGNMCVITKSNGLVRSFPVSKAKAMHVENDEDEE